MEAEQPVVVPKPPIQTQRYALDLSAFDRTVATLRWVWCRARVLRAADEEHAVVAVLATEQHWRRRNAWLRDAATQSAFAAVREQRFRSRDLRLALRCALLRLCKAVALEHWQKSGWWRWLGHEHALGDLAVVRRSVHDRTRLRHTHTSESATICPSQR